MKDANASLKNVFSRKTVVIIGDLVADQFLNGTISRVSREAPVFILRHDTTNTVPGAAANAAINVASLGGKPVLIGIAGNDANGAALIDCLVSSGVDCRSVTTSADLSTTTKVRVLAGQHYAARQQVIRIDYENSGDLSARVKQELRDRLAKTADAADAIIVSDYNYGAVFTEIFADARAIAQKRKIPLVVDSRFRLAEFSNAMTATPNREEVEQILGANFTAADCSRLRERLGYQALLVTNGNQGMVLFEKGKSAVQIDVIGSTEPVDVTGAGDTVIAAYALGLASGMNFVDAANLANHAGGIVVMKKGTASVDIEELLASLANVDQAEASTMAS